MVIKSGHVHTGRGLSRTSTYTLGNLASELARSNGLESLHIDISVINRPGQHWSLSDYEDYAPLTEVSSPDRWTLVDLRPLRPYLHSRIFEVSSELRGKVFASDLALVLGNTHEGSIDWAAPLIEAAQQKQN